MRLSVRNLTSSFFLDEGELRAVDDVSFDIEEGQILALVGESGCGKTIVALSILDLIPSPGRVVSGEVLFEGRDVLRMQPDELRRVRGGGIGLVFQEPAAALNPVHTVGRQIADVLRLHRGLNRTDARSETARLLGEMGFPEPEKRARSYPFELSGGMKQRALIAVALAGRPKLLIADEPTTAVDVTVQAQILDLLTSLRDRYRMSLLIISHDLEMTVGVADRVLVMYAGQIVEEAGSADLLQEPRHPYTQGLLAAIPSIDDPSDAPLREIPGTVADLLDPPAGCRFHPRCALRIEQCSEAVPPLVSIGSDRKCACVLTPEAAS